MLWMLFQVQVFNSLMACGMKLSLNLVILVLVLWYHLPDGSRQNSLWLGWWGSFVILRAFFLLGTKDPPWMAAPSWCSVQFSPPSVKSYDWGRCSCRTRLWCSQSGYSLWCTCGSCRVSWSSYWTSSACGGRRAAVELFWWWCLCDESKSGPHWFVCTSLFCHLFASHVFKGDISWDLLYIIGVFISANRATNHTNQNIVVGCLGQKTWDSTSHSDVSPPSDVTCKLIQIYFWELPLLFFLQANQSKLGFFGRGRVKTGTKVENVKREHEILYFFIWKHVDLLLKKRLFLYFPFKPWTFFLLALNPGPTPVPSHSDSGK